MCHRLLRLLHALFFELPAAAWHYIKFKAMKYYFVEGFQTILREKKFAMPARYRS